MEEKHRNLEDKQNWVSYPNMLKLREESKRKKKNPTKDKEKDEKSDKQSQTE